METQGPLFTQKITEAIKRENIVHKFVTLNSLTTKTYIPDDIAKKCIPAGRKWLSGKL
jgi:hypothetical protein